MPKTIYVKDIEIKTYENLQYFMLYGSNPTNIPWDFALLVFIRWAIAIVGLILNAALFYVTIKCRFLFGTCNFLIGLNAFCAIFSNAFMTIGLVIVLSKIGLILNN
jgi:hypothetical protein